MSVGWPPLDHSGDDAFDTDDFGPCPVGQEDAYPARTQRPRERVTDIVAGHPGAEAYIHDAEMSDMRRVGASLASDAPGDVRESHTFRMRPQDDPRDFDEER
jgi:hypothetical protein